MFQSPFHLRSISRSIGKEGSDPVRKNPEQFSFSFFRFFFPFVQAGGVLRPPTYLGTVGWYFGEQTIQSHPPCGWELNACQNQSEGVVSFWSGA